MGNVLSLEAITVRKGDKTILGPINWSVNSDENWIVLGPNGAGKSTLFKIISATLHPTSGKAKILDEELGRVDVFELRPRIGYVTNSLVELIPDSESVEDAVLTAAYSIRGRWRESYEESDVKRAASLISMMGLEGFADRSFQTLSDGEKKRALIARSLMSNPEILLLDEPAAGLDLGGREDLISRLASLVIDPLSPVTITVTHHVEEIPAGTSHCLLLKEGQAVAVGRIDDVLTSENLSTAYDLPIVVVNEHDRFWARARK